MGPNYQDIVLQSHFSNKPAGGFTDFYQQIESYVNIMAGPAMEKNAETTYLTFRKPLNVGNEDENTVFLLPDTLTTRAGLDELSIKFKDEVIAIIGLGGTGAYILDFLAKTQVKEVHLFDFDKYEIHNAFRSPGRLRRDTDTDFGKYKVDVYKSRYDNFHKNIIAHKTTVDKSSISDMKGVTFAFICVDKGSVKREIFDLLYSINIPFIDTGIGINLFGTSSLNGHIRTSFFSTDEKQQQQNETYISFSDNENDIYKTNIQISELNALNACFAIIRYKQLKGVYSYTLGTSNDYLLFELEGLRIRSEEDIADDNN